MYRGISHVIKGVWVPNTSSGIPACRNLTAVGARRNSFLMTVHSTGRLVTSPVSAIRSRSSCFGRRPDRPIIFHAGLLAAVVLAGHARGGMMDSVPRQPLVRVWGFVGKFCRATKQCRKGVCYYMLHIWLKLHSCKKGKAVVVALYDTHERILG